MHGTAGGPNPWPPWDPPNLHLALPDIPAWHVPCLMPAVPVLVPASAQPALPRRCHSGCDCSWKLFKARNGSRSARAEPSMGHRGRAITLAEVSSPLMPQLRSTWKPGAPLLPRRPGFLPCPRRHETLSLTTLTYEPPSMGRQVYR